VVRLLIRQAEREAEKAEHARHLKSRVIANS
jgi:hypothetical protein